MHTMDQNLAALVDAGAITHAAALEKAQDLENLKRLIHRAEPVHAGGFDFDDFSLEGGGRRAAR